MRPGWSPRAWPWRAKPPSGTTGEKCGPRFRRRGAAATWCFAPAASGRPSTISPKCWAKVLKRPLVYFPGIARDIEEKFPAARLWENAGGKSPSGLRAEGRAFLRNEFGTAPGQIYRKGKKSLVLLPGPGRELFHVGA